MYNNDADPRLVALSERSARFCAFFTITVGLIVLAAWALDIALPKSVLPGLETMKANTALGFLLLGSALYAAAWKKPRAGWWSYLQAIPATLAMLLGVLTLVEYGYTVDLGLDQLLFDAPIEPGGQSLPGRMAESTAAAFALSGLALLLLDFRRWRRASQVAALAGALTGILAILGYVYDVHALYGIGAYSSMALHTAIAFVVTNLGILLARPRRCLMSVVTSQTQGGLMARRLLPLALIAPFLIGFLRVHGEQKGYYESAFGVALVALAYVALFTTFIWRTADVLRQSDLLRSAAERRLRQKDAKLTGIIDTAMDAIVMVDADQRICMFNPAAEQMFGYPAAAVLGRSLDVLLPSRFRAAHFTHIVNFGHSGITSRRMGGYDTIVGARATGEEFPIEASISKLGADGESNFTVILRDITARKRAENELKLAVAEAERANNAKSRFLAAASHDLRQPLAALNLYADVLEARIPPHQQTVLTSMKDCISVLSHLLTDLLDLSKLDAGVVRPKIADFSVFELLADLESVYTLKALAKGLRLRFQPTRLTGHADPILIKRIVGNFIDNAIRYTHRGGAVIGCRRRQGKIWIEVWDSGIGIAANQTTAIFEEFKQLGDEARNRGSGLGLAIAAKNAALLGLEISVRSKPGHGSVFAIELPLGHPETAQFQSSPQAASRALRIALVEDHALVREALAMALQEIGHQVVAAPDGQTLLAELGNLPPDIIVSDYRLAQGETGLDVITAARQATGRVLPAIIITSDTDPKLIASFAGRDVAILHKPLNLNKFQLLMDELTTPAA